MKQDVIRFKEMTNLLEAARSHVCPGPCSKRFGQAVFSGDGEYGFECFGCGKVFLTDIKEMDPREFVSDLWQVWERNRRSMGGLEAVKGFLNCSGSGFVTLWKVELIYGKRVSQVGECENSLVKTQFSAIDVCEAVMAGVRWSKAALESLKSFKWDNEIWMERVEVSPMTVGEIDEDGGASCLKGLSVFRWHREDEKSLDEKAEMLTEVAQ